MKRKLHRSRRSVFGRRGMHPALKTLLWIVACVAVVALGYFGAMVISEGKLPEIEMEVGGDHSADVNKPDSTPNTDKEPNDDKQDGTTPPPADKPVATADGIRAFYLPLDSLTAADVADTLSAARNAGFTAVVFDLQDGADRRPHRPRQQPFLGVVRRRSQRRRQEVAESLRPCRTGLYQRFGGRTEE